MGRIIIEYLPDISEKAEKIISEKITPAMTSYEGDSNQYNLLDILADIISMFSTIISLFSLSIFPSSS